MDNELECRNSAVGSMPCEGVTISECTSFWPIPDLLEWVSELSLGKKYKDICLSNWLVEKIQMKYCKTLEGLILTLWISGTLQSAYQREVIATV